MWARILLSLLLVLPSHPAFTEAPDTPCRSAPLEGLEPWVPLSTEGVDPRAPGYALLLSFHIGDDEQPRHGRVAILRMTHPDSGESLYRGEKRSVLLRAELREPSALVQAYAYNDARKPADLWAQRDEESPVRRRSGPEPGDDLAAWACEILLASELGEPIRFHAGTEGMADGRAASRLLGMGDGRVRRGAIDIERLTKGR